MPAETMVSPETWVTMALICGFVWGGFLIVLTKAIRSESSKAISPSRPGS